MLVDITAHPERNLYFIGATLLRQLKICRHQKQDVLDLHKAYNLTNRNISLDYLLLALDWLFVLGLVDADQDGEVYLCI